MLSAASQCAHMLRASAQRTAKAVGVRGMATADGLLRSCADNTYDTMHFQSSLLRLPIPKLEDTLERYLRSSSAVMSPEAMVKTTQLVDDFRGGVGKKLQYFLQQDDAAHPNTNYVSGPWYDMYLSNRERFPLSLSPQLTWKDEEEPAKMDQAARAANILAAAARFCRSLRTRELAPDVFHTKPDVSKTWWFPVAHQMVPKKFAFHAAAAAGAYALDMSQYAQLFSTSRLPMAGKDVLQTAKHDRTFVIAQRGSRFYKVHITEENGMPLPEENIEAQLRAILAIKPSSNDPAPVGVLTALNRNEWAAIRPSLAIMNSQVLDDVDKALFAITLEDKAPQSQAELSRMMLHGDARNRWFDKSFQVVVAANGQAGVVWEHSWGDGLAMLRFFEEIHNELQAEPVRKPAEPSRAEELEWKLSGALSKQIKDAEADTDAFIASAELEIYETDLVNKADLKKVNLSPDGFMQMVLQLAHTRMHGWTPSTYESATTGAYKHGRTETIRSATPESVEFCKAFLDASTTATERLAALKAAADRHSVLTREAMVGQGWDRHLYGLRHMAKRRGMEDPDVFTDDTYTTMMDIRVSTSTLTSNALQGGGFGPISPRAYSCGYGISDDGSRYHVMSNGLGTAEFVSNIDAALRDMREAIYGAVEADESAEQPSSEQAS